MLPARPFYLIRHGQSEANVQRIAAGGRYDSPLTDLGRSQARTLSPFLTQLEIKPAHVYYSPLMRARDTALTLNETLKLPATSVEELREHDLGAWDGLPWPEVQPHLEAHEQPPGGESVSMFSQRIQVALTDIANRHPGAPPMVVAHGGLFHAIGFLYEYGMSEVQNCHLHYFEPYPSFDLFPWRVWMFDMEGEKLVKKPAPFCVSQAMEQAIN